MAGTGRASGKRVYHRAKLIAANGDVSPLCAEVPKALDLKKTCWTNRNEAVTCKKCLVKMAAGTTGG